MKQLKPSLWLAAASLAAISTGYAQAQTATEYPVKTIKIIVGFSPGGSTDIVARTLAKKLSESFGKPVVVENRPSTGAIIGALTAAKAAPDGYGRLAQWSSILPPIPSWLTPH